ncbi:hypothetical protein HDU96_011019 [Phlyctochytrium bullatum]|nr:hypothetical protein HDU96_011019 [Phlyctochytrium bullatum]
MPVRGAAAAARASGAIGRSSSVSSAGPGGAAAEGYAYAKGRDSMEGRSLSTGTMLHPSGAMSASASLASLAAAGGTPGVVVGSAPSGGAGMSAVASLFGFQSTPSSPSLSAATVGGADKMPSLSLTASQSSSMSAPGGSSGGGGGAGWVLGFVRHGHAMLPRIPVCAPHTRERLRQAAHLFDLGGQEAAAATFARAMVDGDPLARFAWAMCLLNGFGVRVSERQALGHLAIAARDGEYLAMYELGNYYRYGRASLFHEGASLLEDELPEDHEYEDEEDEDFEYLDEMVDQPHSLGGAPRRYGLESSWHASTGNNAGGAGASSSSSTSGRRASYDESGFMPRQASSGASVRRAGSVLGNRRPRALSSVAAGMVDPRAYLSEQEIPKPVRRLSSASVAGYGPQPLLRSASSASSATVTLGESAQAGSGSTGGVSGSAAPSFSQPPPLVRTLTEVERRRWMLRWYMAGADCGHAESRVAAAECLLSSAGVSFSSNDGSAPVGTGVISKAERKQAAEYLRLASEQHQFYQQHLWPALQHSGPHSHHHHGHHHHPHYHAHHHSALYPPTSSSRWDAASISSNASSSSSSSSMWRKSWAAGSTSSASAGAGTAVASSSQSMFGWSLGGGQTAQQHQQAAGAAYLQLQQQAKQAPSSVDRAASTASSARSLHRRSKSEIR